MLFFINSNIGLKHMDNLLSKEYHYYYIAYQFYVVIYDMVYAELKTNHRRTT